MPGELRRELGQAAALVGHEQLAEATEDVLADDDLREAEHARPAEELLASGRVLCQIDLLVGDSALVEELLGA